MSRLCLLFVLGVVIAGGQAQHDHDDHDHAGHSHTFFEVMEFFQAPNEWLTYQQTTQLIRHMLYRVDLCGDGIDCSACFNTTTVLRYLNRTEDNTLNEEGFHQLSVILTVAMRDPVAECANSEANLGPGGRTLSDFLELLTADDHHHEANHAEGTEEHPHLNLHKVEEILHDIGERYRMGELEVGPEGQLISGPNLDLTVPVECLTPETLFEGLGLDDHAEIEGEGLEEAASMIVLRVLQGYCMSPEGLPPPHNFLADIFNKHADKSTGLIPSEKFEEILTSVGIGGSDDHAEDDGHGHDHAVSRKRRDVAPSGGRRVKRAANHEPDHESAHEHGESYNVAENCYSAEKLLQVFTDNQSASVSTDTFSRLCPSIVQQLLSGACKATEEESIKTSTDAEAYGYGTLAVFLITLCTLLGALFATIKNANLKRRLMAFMMSIAIGTLLGDSALHLIPEAMGLHAHSAGAHDHGGSGVVEVEPYAWKMAALLASFYAFFLLELIMNRSPGEHSHNNDEEEVPPSKADMGKLAMEAEEKLSHRALIVMIFLGDGLHNFADGMAIGAAFSLSVSGGLSTSVAILCHELPHELGDFAALLTAGLSIRNAMIMNFVSGCTAFIGLYVGVALGGMEEGRVWIFIIAAGMFLYVALANLVPEVMRMFRTAKDSVIIFICINIGILLGFGIMFVIAVFEEHIRI